MRLLLVSLLVSLVVHALIAVALTRCPTPNPKPPAPTIHLEVSRVDFSVEAAPKPEPPKSAEASDVADIANTSNATSQAAINAPLRPSQPIRPDYPSSARRRGEEGDVTLEARVNPDGTVEKAQIIVSSGYVALDDAALKAVKAAQFTSATTDGCPTAATARLTLQFRLK